MNIYEFMSGSPWITFWLVWPIAFVACIMMWCTSGVIKWTLSILINRPLRHMNIRKHGWPPLHCDADGDIIQRDTDDS